MDSPSNSFSGLSPELNQLSSAKSCSYSPIVIDLADSTVLVDTFSLEAIERVVSDLHSSWLICVTSFKGLALYTGPNSIVCTQQCQEMLNLRKFALEKKGCSIKVSSSLTEYASPCICYLYIVSACTQLELDNILRNFNQFDDQYTLLEKNLEHTFTEVN